MSTGVLVFVPGVLGSELFKGDDKIWPGSLTEAISGFSNEKFEKLMDPGLTAKDIVRSAGGGLINIYGSWIKAFEAIVRGGKSIFVERPASGQTKTLHVWPYDWRLDLIGTTTLFANKLDEIVAATPDADLFLVCHSLGGLIARYYLESGKFDARPAFQKISLLATLGTPHNGAPIAFAGVTGLHKTNFLSVPQSKRLANDPQYPSLYQTFPSPAHAFIWDADMTDAYKTFAIDDAQIVSGLKLVASSLKAWRDFRDGITGKRPGHIRYFFIVGSRQETLTRVLWDGKALQKIELEDAGDGTVPLLGSIVDGVQTEFVGKSHVDLIDTKPARQTLARLFGADTLFALVEERISLSVRDHVVTTEDDILVQINFDPSISTFKGDLAWQRAKQPAEGQEVSEKDFRDFAGGGSRRIELVGPHISYVNLKADPIPIAGIYRPVLTQDGKTEKIIGPAFAVQQKAP